MVNSFRYLERVISAVENDWTVVIQNLEKAREVWRMMMRILSREGTRPLVLGFLFKSVVQLVLLFGAETWAITPNMGQVLGYFQDQVAQRLTGRIPQR